MLSGFRLARKIRKEREMKDLQTTSPANLPWVLRTNNTIADSTGKTVADVRFASKQGAIIVALANAAMTKDEGCGITT